MFCSRQVDQGKTFFCKVYGFYSLWQRHCPNLRYPLVIVRMLPIGHKPRQLIRRVQARIAYPSISDRLSSCKALSAKTSDYRHPDGPLRNSADYRPGLPPVVRPVSRPRASFSSPSPKRAPEGKIAFRAGLAVFRLAAGKAMGTTSRLSRYSIPPQRW